uniref:Steroid 5-alpha reductase C-terminal domain-containing protein n=1 Tax=Sphenodon punctatus TaxID=8508 RepID=A0A8D0HM08_SPHPU
NTSPVVAGHLHRLSLKWPLWLGGAIECSSCLILGSGTFILLAHLSLNWGNTQYPRQQVQTGLVTLWGLRLGLFLFLRILKEGHDRRFNHVRDSPGTFFVFWTMQGAWIILTLLPTLLLNLEKHNKPLGLWDYLGWSIWAMGFLTEAVADQQKWHFRSDPDNAGKFIQSGLWAYSRHPNYLGEILLWTGLFTSAASVLQGWQYLSAISPLLVWFLLNYVSGIPILEREAMRQWGKDAEFQAYLRNTPVLWPFVS